MAKARYRYYRLDRDGVCLRKRTTSKNVQRITGFSGAHIWQCAMKGRKMGGVYDVYFADLDDAEKTGEYSERETRSKFGDKNYEEWCAMNRRYGKKEQRGI